MEGLAVGGDVMSGGGRSSVAKWWLQVLLSARRLGSPRGHTTNQKIGICIIKKDKI